MEALAEKLINLRTSKGWSQSELARRASKFGRKVHPQNIQQVEAGVSKQPRFISELSKALEIPVDLLLDDSKKLNAGGSYQDKKEYSAQENNFTDETVSQYETQDSYIPLQLLEVKKTKSTGNGKVNKLDFVRHLDALKEWATGYIAPEKTLKNIRLMTAPDDSNVAAGIYQGDPLFVDTSVTNYNTDGFYVLSFREEPRVRYLRGNEAQNCIEVVSFEGMGEKVSQVNPDQEDNLCLLGKVYAWWTLKRFAGRGG